MKDNHLETVAKALGVVGWGCVLGAAVLALTAGPGLGDIAVRMAIAVLLGSLAWWARDAPRVLRAIAKTDDAASGRVMVRSMWRRGQRWSVRLAATRGARNFAWPELTRQLRTVTGRTVTLQVISDRVAELLIEPPRRLQAVSDTLSAVAQRRR